MTTSTVHSNSYTFTASNGADIEVTVTCSVPSDVANDDKHEQWIMQELQEFVSEYLSDPDAICGDCQTLGYLMDNTCNHCGGPLNRL